MKYVRMTLRDSETSAGKTRVATHVVSACSYFILLRHLQAHRIEVKKEVTITLLINKYGKKEEEGHEAMVLVSFRLFLYSNLSFQ